MLSKPNSDLNLNVPGSGALKPDTSLPTIPDGVRRIEVSLQGEIVAFATPCHSGNVCLEYMRSMASTYHRLASMGVQPIILTVANDSMVTKARNVLVSLFLDSPAQRLFFIDSDMGWDADECISLIAAMKHTDKDIVAVAGPRKMDTPSFCTMLKNPLTVCPETDMAEAETVGTGFICIHRRVIEKMIEADPDDWFMEFQTKLKTYNIFDTLVEDKTFWSEDYMFCRRAKKLGFKVWVDPRYALTHVGVKAWNGKLADGLKAIGEYFPPVKPLD